MGRARRPVKKTYDPDTLSFTRPLKFLLDKELNIIHSDGDCPDLRFPKKYNYMGTVYAHNKKQARELDKTYKACERCRKLEQKKRGTAGRESRKRWARRRKSEGLDYS